MPKRRCHDQAKGHGYWREHAIGDATKPNAPGRDEARPATTSRVPA
ncbi:MAG: hypothetical protein WCC99_12170 [Candidatus Sulfotelmatobacter sp.]